jgi:polyribonucleotide nucleotidyltransferase
MSGKRINAVSDVLSLNQEIQVKIIEIDKMGRINLSLLYQK